MSQEQTPAPLPPADVEVSAVDASVQTRDMGAYKEARRAERQGTPLTPPKPVSTPTQTTPTAAASAAASPETPAASTDASSSPASEPGPKKDRGVVARTGELTAEVQALQELLKTR